MKYCFHHKLHRILENTDTHKKCGGCHRFLLRKEFNKMTTYGNEFADPHTCYCKQCNRNACARYRKKFRETDPARYQAMIDLHNANRRRKRAEAKREIGH